MKRGQLYADVVVRIRREAKQTHRGAFTDDRVRYLVGDCAKALSHSLSRSPDYYGEHHASPLFDPRKHAGTKSRPGCTCQGPKFRFDHGQPAVRCFDDAWWNGQQEIARAAQEKRERDLDEKLKQGQAEAGAPLTFAEPTFRTKFGDDAYRLPRVGDEAADAKLLADATFVIVTARGGPTVYCTDKKAWRRAKSAATKERTRLLREAKEARGRKLLAKAKKATLEPWMLAEMLATRVYDDAIMEVAADLGIEALTKPKKAAYNWFDSAVRKLPAEDVELLFKSVALRAKAKEFGRELTKGVDGTINRKFLPGVRALRKKLLEAAGINEKETKPRGRVPDIDDTDDDQFDADEQDESGEAECVQCGCRDSIACEDGCSWIVVDRDRGVGVCSSCAESEDEARELMAGAVAA
jgi:hypothetical protein